jgi:hypothetical protein
MWKDIGRERNWGRFEGARGIFVFEQIQKFFSSNFPMTPVNHKNTLLPLPTPPIPLAHTIIPHQPAQHTLQKRNHHAKQTYARDLATFFQFSFLFRPADILPRRKSRMPHGERLSLVQYNNPELIPLDEEEPDPVEELKRIASCSLPPIEPEKQLRRIMDCILPPRKREIDGQSWMERASTVPCTRFDILGLQQRFENELHVSHAKPFGICPIRRRIYDELFGECLEGGKKAKNFSGLTSLF